MSPPVIAAVVDACRKTVENWRDPRIVAVYLYGSMILGNPRTDSDLDVAILDSGESRISPEDEARFMDSLERATHQAVDLRMVRDCSLSHQAHILREGQLVWAADPQAVRLHEQEFFKAHREQLRVPPDQWQDFLKRLTEKAGAQR